MTSEGGLASEGQLELISFEIGGQEFCIDIRSVREIRGWTAATQMPHTPSYMLGVINLRGAVMPVIDLRCRLGLGVTEVSSRHVIVVIQHGAQLAGVLVDGVQETFQVDASVLQEPPQIETTTPDLFVDAIIPIGERLLSRLVVSAFLPAQRLAA